MRAIVLCACALVLAVPACRSRRTVRGPHGSVTVIKVRHAPPPPPRVVVVRPACPGPTYVWVKGHHVYREDRYVWVRGRWAAPPRRGAVWVPGHHHNGQWHYGRWR